MEIRLNNVDFNEYWILIYLSSYIISY